MPYHYHDNNHRNDYYGNGDQRRQWDPNCPPCFKVLSHLCLLSSFVLDNCRSSFHIDHGRNWGIQDYFGCMIRGRVHSFWEGWVYRLLLVGIFIVFDMNFGYWVPSICLCICEWDRLSLTAASTYYFHHDRWSQWSSNPV